MLKSGVWNKVSRMSFTACATMLFILILGAAAVAQATMSGTSAITGTVIDPSGAAVAGATVRVVSAATGLATVLHTNSDGLYQTPPLQPGQYTVTVTAKGFKRTIQRNVLLQLGARQAVNIRLAVGGANQTVNVTAAPPLINTTSPTQATVVGAKQVEDLPLLNRTAGQLIGLTPGVYFTYVDNGSYGAPRFNMGASTAYNEYVDGLPAGGLRIATGQMEVSVPAEAVQEVRVESGLSGASTGQAEGGAIYMDTKSGTDHYHGSLYYYMRNTALDSTNFWAHTRPVDHWDLGGGSIGGPIFRHRFQNKLFFYADYEKDNELNPAGGSFSIPTMAMRQGNFQGLSPIYDPTTTKEVAPNQYTRQQFSCNGQINVICPNRFDPVMQKVLSYYPTIPTSITNPTNDYVASWNNVVRDVRWVGSINWDISNSDQFNFNTVYLRGNTGTTGLPGFAPQADPVGNHYYPEGSAMYGFTETHIFSPTLMNNISIGYRPRWWVPNFAAYNPSMQWDKKLGINGYVQNEDLGFPSFNFSGFSGIGPGYLTYAQHSRSIDVSDNVKWIKGSHNVTFGIQGEGGHKTILEGINPTGTFNFDPYATTQPAGDFNSGGNSMASALIGFVSNASIYSGGANTMNQWYWSPYFGDAWQITRHFNISYGLRWTVDLPLYTRFYGSTFLGAGVPSGQGFNPTAINPVCNCPGTLTFMGLNGTPKGFYNVDWDRFTPRLGFTWAPGSFKNRLAIRGGFGMYSALPALDIGVPNLGYYQAQVGFSTQGEGVATKPIFYLSQGFPPYPSGGNPADLTPGFGAVPLGQNPYTGVQYIPRNWQMGYIEDLGLSVDYELPGHLMVGVRGQGELGRKLDYTGPTVGNRSGGQIISQLPPKYWGVQGNLQPDTPFPQYAYVLDGEVPEGTIDWYGLTLEANKHFSNGLSLLASWQLSKSVGIMGCESIYKCYLSRSAGVIGGWANAPTGMPYKRANISFVYALPFGRGHEFINQGLASKLFGNWTVSSVITLDSGIPFGVNNNGGSLNCFCTLASRLNQVGNINGPKTLNEWFNTSAFARPKFGQIGTSGGVPLIGPPMDMWDGEILKTIGLGESKSIKVSGEFFNVTNTAQWGLPGTTYGTPQFGVISGPLYSGLAGAGAGEAIAARLVQLGIHFYF